MLLRGTQEVDDILYCFLPSSPSLAVRVFIMSLSGITITLSSTWCEEETQQSLDYIARERESTIIHDPTFKSFFAFSPNPQPGYSAISTLNHHIINIEIIHKITAKYTIIGKLFSSIYQTNTVHVTLNYFFYNIA